MSDISLFPPTSILSNHSHQIYHHSTAAMLHPITLATPVTPPNLAQDRFPVREIPSQGRTTTYLRSPFPSSIPPSRRHPIPSSAGYTPQPPSNGSSPLSNLPDEVLLCIFAQLQLQDLLRLRRTCIRFTPLATHPSLHRSLALFALPPSPLPRLLTHHILPSVHHLHLHLFPLPTPSPISATFSKDERPEQPTSRIMALLRLIPADQLVSLSLPFSAPFLPAMELGAVLRRIGGKLEKLDLRGSAVEDMEYLEWMDTVGRSNPHGGLRELDLGFTSISGLPLPPTDEMSAVTDTCWHALRKLSLASCSSLSANAIASFLAVLPANIESLDLSRLDQVSFTALRDMRVTFEDLSTPESTSTELREIKLVGIDHLTRSNIRTLKNHWQSQRLSILPQSPPTFSWGSLAPAPAPQVRRVWGEPRTPEPLPIPPASLPRLIPRSNLATADLASLSLSGCWSSGSNGTPDLTSSSSASSSTSNVDSYTSSRSSFSRVSALSTHSALWSALSQDADQGMEASPGVWRSKLPDNPYLPSRSDPKGRTTSSSSSSASGFGRQWSWRGMADSPRVSDADYIPRRSSVDTKEEMKNVGINITHSAILESEDEEGYRMFIGEVAGADTTLPVSADLGLGMGLGLGMFGGMGGWGGSGVAGYNTHGEEYLEGIAGI